MPSPGMLHDGHVVHPYTHSPHPARACACATGRPGPRRVPLELP
ncbi:hypothetical protein EBESD8_58940 [Rhodococcus aetherivorans]|nr:hypothetical protein EBESD8_58940 [Rhodococcus aetherivorans]